MWVAKCDGCGDTCTAMPAPGKAYISFAAIINGWSVEDGKCTCARCRRKPKKPRAKRVLAKARRVA